MSSFFKSEQVQKSLTRMQELYVEINNMGVILSSVDKKLQLEKLLELIEVQQTMFMRISLSDDPTAKELLGQVKQSAVLLGMNPADVNPTFYGKLKDQVHSMIQELE